MTPETAADRIRAFLGARTGQSPWRGGELIAWVVDTENEEHQLTVTDLEELLAKVNR